MTASVDGLRARAAIGFGLVNRGEAEVRAGRFEGARAILAAAASILEHARAELVALAIDDTSRAEDLATTEHAIGHVRSAVDRCNLLEANRPRPTLAHLRAELAIARRLATAARAGHGPNRWPLGIMLSAAFVAFRDALTDLDVDAHELADADLVAMITTLEGLRVGLALHRCCKGQITP